MYNRANFCRTDPAFWRKLWHLALPISVQSLMLALLGLIDILMVGQLGETAIAAVGLGSRILFFNLILCAALGGGLSILAAQYVGAGNSAGVRQTLAQALTVSTALSLPFTLAYLFFSEAVIGLSSADPQLIQLGGNYLFITAPSVLLGALIIPLESAARAYHNARIPTQAAALTIIINILLNYILIFGALGLPAMGVAGSALGTTLARLIQLLLLYGSLRLRPNCKPMIPTPQDFYWSLKPAALGPYIKVSLPVILQDGLWAFGLLLYNLIYSQIGVEALAIMSAIATIEGVLIALFVGLAIAASIMLGHELGGGHFDRAWQQAWLFMLATPMVAVVIGLIMIVFSTEALSLLGQLKADTLVQAQPVILVSALTLWLKVINLTGILGVLRSGGDVKATVMINVAGMWLVGLPLAWLAANYWHLPLYWVFILGLMDELTKALLIIWRITRRRWLHNLVKDAPLKAPAS